MGTPTAFEGLVRVAWCDEIADKTSPTVAELNDGVDITPYLTRDGLDTSGDSNTVGTAMLHETYDAEVVGSWKITPKLKLARFVPAGDDAAWDLAEYGKRGFLVVRTDVEYATAWAAAQRVRVYPAQMHEPIPAPTALNTLQTFMLTVAGTSQPDQKAVVAAS